MSLNNISEPSASSEHAEQNPPLASTPLPAAAHPDAAAQPRSGPEPISLVTHFKLGLIIVVLCSLITLTLAALSWIPQPTEEDDTNTTDAAKVPMVVINPARLPLQSSHVKHTAFTDDHLHTLC